MVRQWPLLYLKALREKPIRTNIISGSIVMLLGDGIAQSMERFHKDEAKSSSVTNFEENDDALKRKPASGGTAASMLSSYDPVRAGVMVSWAAVGDVPINLALFSLIERTMRPLGIPTLATLPQSLLKSLLFFVPSTLIRMPCFLVYVTTVEHFTRNLLEPGRPMSHNWDKCLSTMQNKISEDLGAIVNNGAKLWIPTNTFLFFMLPTELRTLGRSFVTVGWMTYLSLMQHKRTPEPTPVVLVEQAPEPEPEPVMLDEPTVFQDQVATHSMID